MLSILAESLLIATRIEPFRDERRMAANEKPQHAEPKRRWFRLAGAL